jgi:hypothetical protein
VFYIRSTIQRPYRAAIFFGPHQTFILTPPGMKFCSDGMKEKGSPIRWCITYLWNAVAEAIN